MHRQLGPLVNIHQRTVGKPNGERSEHLGAGADDHSGTQCRMPLLLLERRAAQRRALIDRAIIADLCGFADHHAHSVIDENAASHDGPGVDLDTRHPP